MADLNKLDKLAQQLVELKVKEVTQLLQILKEQHGIEPAATAVAPAANNAQQVEEAQQEEKTSFNVMLQSVGGAKLKVIKAIKNITDLGLKESKELADSAPKAIKEGVKKAEAEAIKKELEEAGAQVTLE